MGTSNWFLSPCRWFLMLCALGGCSDAVAPVLQLELIAGVPMDTGRLDVILTKPDGTTGSTYFLKGGSNSFTLMQPTATNPMLSTTVAVDLPLGTTGTIQVRVESRAEPSSTADMAVAADDMASSTPPAPPAAEASGCATVTIVPGTLNKVSMPLMMPAQDCKMQ